MRSEIVVVAGICSKDPAQMGLAEDDDVIEALAADRTNQPLCMPVLVWPKYWPDRRTITPPHDDSSAGARRKERSPNRITFDRLSSLTDLTQRSA